MRLPAPPPRTDVSELFASSDEAAFLDRYVTARPLDDAGRYLSWGEFRRRPAPDGMTIEEAWTFQRIARQLRAVKLPLLDKTGLPFTVTEIGPLRNQLHEIDREASGRLSSFGPVAIGEATNRQFITSLIEEPYNSSVYEGAVTTRERAKELIAEGDEPVTRDDRMVLNNYRAMEFVKSQTDALLTPRLLLDLHEIVTRNTLDKPDAEGRLRRPDEDVGVWYEDELVHAPPAAEDLEARLDRLCAFANEDYRKADPFLNPITRAIMLHLVIGYDHPFVDGNGRTARALFYWYVLKHGYWLLEHVSISKVIKEESGKAYELAYLNTETDDADATYFVLHQLGTILAAMDGLKAYLVKKSEELDSVSLSVQRMGRDGSVNHRQAALLIEAANHPARVFTVGEHQHANGVVYLTARKDLEGLVEKGLLVRSKLGRQVEYRASSTLPTVLVKT